MKKLCFTLLINFLFVAGIQAGMVDNVRALSSDAMEGRQSGTPGGEMATQYLVSKLQETSILPLGDSYQQKFTIFTGMEKNGANNASFKDELDQSKFEPLSFSSSGDLESAVVFAGYGISIPKNEPILQYDRKNRHCLEWRSRHRQSTLSFSPSGIY